MAYMDRDRLLKTAGAKFDYEYAANTSNIANMAYNHRGDSNEVDYSYDDLDRLILVEYDITEESNEVFTIDDLGNRDNVNVRDGTNINYVIDEYTNRYDSVDGNNLAYNEAGDLTTDKNGYIYEYDYENRITKITRDGNDIAEYAYDALGRRIWKRDSIANTNNVYYYNDQWQVLVDFNDSDVEQQRFVYGNYIDEPILMVANGVEYQYLYDHLYNIVALTNSTGTPYERYEYDAYGNCTILSPTYEIQDTSDYENPYLFTGRRVDIIDEGSLKLQYNRNRYYDQYTGRWLTHDPQAFSVRVEFGESGLQFVGTEIGRDSSVIDPHDEPGMATIVSVPAGSLHYVEGMNLYEYAHDNPLRYADPLGYWGKDVHYSGTVRWAFIRVSSGQSIPISLVLQRHIVVFGLKNCVFGTDNEVGEPTKGLKCRYNTRRNICKRYIYTRSRIL
jgi:RHS repeat-associated protein